jgi:hypothetical protein
MAALDFPASPTLNQTYTANGLTWKWDGVSWVTQNAGLTGTVQVSEGGTSATDSAGARANLGLEIGVDVQGWSADLDAIDALAGTSGFLKKTAADTWSLDTNSYLTGNQSITISGDASGTGTTAISLTLATVPLTKGGTGKTTAVAAQNALQGYTTTAKSAGTTVLTNASTYTQEFTGASTHTVQMPDATTVTLGWSHQIINRSTQVLTVRASEGSFIYDIPAFSLATVKTVDISAAVGNWWAIVDGFMVGTVPVANGGTGAISLTGLIKGNGTAAMTAAVAGTDYLAPAAIGSTVQAYDADLGAIAALAGTSGLLKKTAANTWTLDTTAYSTTTGTVTSVGGTGTVSGLTLSGTVTTSGNLTLGGTLAVTASNFASQTANTFLCAPNGSAGVPTFRAIAAADIPTLNQNTTGSAATLTTARTLTIGSTGKTFNGSANVSWTVAEIGAMLSTGIADNTDTYINCRVVRNSNSSASNDGIFFGYGNSNSGITRVYGGGSTTAHSYMDSGGVWKNSAGTLYYVPGGALGTPASGTLTNCTFPTLNQNTTGSSASCTGNAATATTATNATQVNSTAQLNGYAVSAATVAYSSGAGGPMIGQAQGSGAAMLSFHRPSVYGVNFGLDTDNVLKVGGWSMGAVSYAISHAGNGGWIRIATLTAANSATLASTSCFSTGYKYYCVIFDNLVPVTNAVELRLQFYAGSYLAASMLTYTNLYNPGGSLVTNPTTYLSLSDTTRVRNTAGLGYRGRLFFTDPASASTFPACFGEYNTPDSTNGAYLAWGVMAGVYQANAACTGFQVYASSGNISTGSITIWGWN